MRLELTRPNGHYPLKVACIPISPPARECFIISIWSGKRDSNSRPQPWQGCALPTELFPHIRTFVLFCECKGNLFFLFCNSYYNFFYCSSYVSSNKVIYITIFRVYSFLSFIFYMHKRNPTFKACLCPLSVSLIVNTLL